VPEGDTIHRAALRLRPALEGARLERFEAPRSRPPHPRTGEEIESVEARGKHLLIRFEGGLTLRTHLGMSGSWQLYRSGERWRRARHLARVVIAVHGWEAVCFSAPSVELAAEPAIGHLGPDLCRVDVDLDECLDRMARAVRAEPSTTVADALLDQRICCGVGNVYKSEVCFARRVHPLTPLGDLDDATRAGLLSTAARLLQANLGHARRSTIVGRPGTLGVYGRARRPCRRCGTPIVMQRTGRHARSTYWCPRCQPEPG
jgi:endonuclease VIII